MALKQTRRSLVSSILTIPLMGCCNPFAANSANLPRRYYIYLSGELHPNTGKVVEDMINSKIVDGFREFYIAMSSSGGSALIGIGLYNYLMSLRSRGDVNVITHNISHVDSAAVDIFMAGQTRLANENSTFLVHAAFMDQEPPKGADNLNLEYLNLRQIDDIDVAILRAQTRMPAVAIADYLHDRRDHILSAQQALAFGMVNRIVDLTLPADSSLTALSDNTDQIEGLKIGPEIPVGFLKPTRPSLMIIPGPNVRYEIYVP